MVFRMPVGRGEQIPHLGERKTGGAVGDAPDRSIVRGALKIRGVYRIGPCRGPSWLCAGAPTEASDISERTKSAEEILMAKTSTCMGGPRPSKAKARLSTAHEAAPQKSTGRAIPRLGIPGSIQGSRLTGVNKRFGCSPIGGRLASAGTRKRFKLHPATKSRQAPPALTGSHLSYEMIAFSPQCAGGCR